jgi:hypothetical protein
MSSDAGKPQKRLKSGPDKNDPPQASVPSPALLQDYARVGSELPELVGLNLAKAEKAAKYSPRGRRLAA